jgi:polar amino acid transport system substrate-binding protein
MAGKILFCLLALSIVFATPEILPAEEKVFVNGIDINFPPFAYLDKDNHPDGFDVRAVEWIAKEMGFSVRHEPTEWDSVLACLKDKGIDLIASGMTITPKMEEQVNFTIPYWTVRKVIIAAKDSSLTVEQIMTKGRRLAVLRGTDEAGWIEENLIEKGGKRLTLVYYDSAPSAVEDLLRGKIAGAAMSDAPARDAVRNNPVKIVGPLGMPDEQFGYAVRKEDTALLEVLNEGLKRLMASPYWKELQKKYMD